MNKLISIFALATMVLVSLEAVAFTPFTQVNNVCPECEQQKADVVTTIPRTRMLLRVVIEAARPFRRLFLETIRLCDL